MNVRDFWLILHFTGLFIGLGSGFSLLVLNFASNKLSAAEKGAFMRTASILGYIGPAGLVLLLISGLGLTIPVWSSYKSIALFHTKLTLFIVLLLFVGLGHMLRKRSAGSPPSTLLKAITPVPFILGLIIVCLAVLSFH